MLNSDVFAKEHVFNLFLHVGSEGLEADGLRKARKAIGLQ